MNLVTVAREHALVSRCIESNQPQETVGFVRAHAAHTRVGRKTQSDALPKKKGNKCPGQDKNF